MAENQKRSDDTIQTGSILGLGDTTPARNDQGLGDDVAEGLHPEGESTSRVSEDEADTIAATRERGYTRDTDAGGVAGGTRDDGFEGGGEVSMGGRDPKVRRQP